MKKFMVMAAALVAVIAGAWCVTAVNIGAASAAQPMQPVAVTASPASAEPTAEEIMFVQMMLEHHKQAVRMGQIMLAKPEVPERVVNLATSVQAKQETEISDSERWLAAWGTEPGTMTMDHSSHTMMTMGGMISDDGFARLEASSGADAARTYLDLMIEHHDGAIASAGDIYPNLANTWVVSFARHIVNEQTVEVDGMTRMRASLG